RQGRTPRGAAQVGRSDDLRPGRGGACRTRAREYPCRGGAGHYHGAGTGSAVEVVADPSRLRPIGTVRHGHARDGHLPGNLDWRALADPSTTHIYYMAGRTARMLAAGLLEAGLDGETPVVV